MLMPFVVLARQQTTSNLNSDVRNNTSEICYDCQMFLSVIEDHTHKLTCTGPLAIMVAIK